MEDLYGMSSDCSSTSSTSTSGSGPLRGCTVLACLLAAFFGVGIAVSCLSWMF